MAEEKRCGTCKHFLEEDCGDTVNVCNYILPDWISNLIDELPVSRSSFYDHKTDGSDCNAWQGKEEVNVLGVIEKQCKHAMGFAEAMLNDSTLNISVGERRQLEGKALFAQQILTILDQQENVK